MGVTVNYPYVYLSVNTGDETAGFHVVDVSDPARPTRTGFLPNSKLPMNIPRDHTSAGAFSYVSNEVGVIVIDATDPANPVVAGFVTPPPGGPTLGLAVRDNLVYVAQEEGSLAIMDVSDPRAPKLLGAQPLPNAPQDVALSGNYAYVPGRYHSVEIVDVSDPRHPRSLPTQLPTGRGISVEGSHAYLGTSGAGIQVLDISRPTSPMVIGGYRTAGYARKGVVHGGRLFIADAEAGLWSVPLAAATEVTASSVAQPAVRRPSVMRPARPRVEVPVVAPVSRPNKKRRLAATGSGATCVVSVTADDGPGSLRDCLAAAGPGDTITFDAGIFPPDALRYIWLRSPLALTQDNLTIDASSAGVGISVSGCGPRASKDGHALLVLSNGNTIQGLTFSCVPGVPILVSGGASHNVIGGDRSQGAGPNGRGNRIQGGGPGGIVISGEGTRENVVIGNYFGVNSDGKTSSGGGAGPCVAIAAGAKANRVGSTVPGERNIVGVCGPANGVLITGPGTTDNIVIGNYLGLNASGDDTIRCGDGWNCGVGEITLNDRASRNRIGGLEPGERNVISGSGREGICVADFGTVDNAIIGNYIGTDASATKGIGNTQFGIWLDGTSSRTRIERNVFSQDRGSATLLWGDYNVFLGNRIGIDPSGTIPLPVSEGILMMSILTTRHNRIGGDAAGEANVIVSGESGVDIQGFGTENNFVQGNFIGIDSIGANRAPAGGGGRNSVVIQDGSKRNVVGGSAEADANLIAGSRGEGVNIRGEGVSYNFIGRNRVGVNRDGSASVGNGGNGVMVSGGDHTFIMNNQIASSGRAGVFNNNGAATTVRGNAIRDNGSGIVLIMTSPTPAPVIRNAGANSVSGTACAGCVVEVFSDARGQGGYFEGAVRATAEGNFTLTKPGGFRGPNLTATATNADGLTSQFSAPVAK